MYAYTCPSCSQPDLSSHQSFSNSSPTPTSACSPPPHALTLPPPANNGRTNDQNRRSHNDYGHTRYEKSQFGDDERLRSLRFGPVAWTSGASHSEVFRLTASRAQLGMRYYVRATNDLEWVSLAFNLSEDANAFYHTWNALQLDGYADVRTERLLSGSGNGKVIRKSRRQCTWEKRTGRTCGTVWQMSIH